MEAYQKAIGGENFEELIKEYGEDPGTETYPDGYVFTYNEMDPDFETASFALKAREISPIVEGTYGYHIIKAYDKFEEEKYFTEKKETIKARCFPKASGKSFRNGSTR